MNRIERIREYGKSHPKTYDERKAVAEGLIQEKYDEVESAIDELVGRIDEMMPRINEFIETAGESEANGIFVSYLYNDDGKLGDLSRNDSDYVDNCLRFIVHKEKDYFVITGITLAESDIEYVDIEDGRIFYSGQNPVEVYDILNKFISQYEVFEKNVYAYIDFVIDNDLMNG
ncbi:MAG: hypothetical protein IJM14_09505 [Lachnospiraceae bacterium]|nr:hypothetical protein [Lachnospiraceae bacterium]